MSCARCKNKNKQIDIKSERTPVDVDLFDFNKYIPKPININTITDVEWKRKKIIAIENVLKENRPESENAKIIKAIGEHLQSQGDAIVINLGEQKKPIFHIVFIK